MAVAVATAVALVPEVVVAVALVGAEAALVRLSGCPISLRAPRTTIMMMEWPLPKLGEGGGSTGCYHLLRQLWDIRSRGVTRARSPYQREHIPHTDEGTSPIPQGALRYTTGRTSVYHRAHFGIPQGALRYTGGGIYHKGAYTREGTFPIPQTALRYTGGGIYHKARFGILEGGVF